MKIDETRDIFGYIDFINADDKVKEASNYDISSVKNFVLKGCNDIILEYPFKLKKVGDNNFDFIKIADDNSIVIYISTSLVKPKKCKYPFIKIGSIITVNKNK